MQASNFSGNQDDDHKDEDFKEVVPPAVTKEEAMSMAKQIPKGLTVKNSASLRAAILNTVIRLLQMGQIKRGQQIKEWGLIVGMQDDRPKHLIQYIKGGGGNEQQIIELATVMHLIE